MDTEPPDQCQIRIRGVDTPKMYIGLFPTRRAIATLE